MPDPTNELNLPPEQSSYWKERSTLSQSEVLELRGTRGMDRLVWIKSRLPYEINFEVLANDLYGEIFRPFGHDVKGYRETNTVVIGSGIERTDYTIVPRLMRSFSQELQESFGEAMQEPNDISKVIACARKAHELVYIHPFPDGNGRIARGLTHYVLKRLGYFLPAWRYAGRSAYLDAIEEGYEDKRVFERFLTGALIASYQEKEQSLSNSGYEQFGRLAVELKSVRESFEGHLKKLEQKDVATV